MLLLIADVLLLTHQNRELKTALQSTTPYQEVEPLKPGERVEPFNLQTLDGSISELSYSDPTKNHLLFVLSTTCPHCEKTLVSWNEITETNKQGRCEIIGVCINRLDETRKYLVARHPSFYTLHADSSFGRKYKISGVPETILVKGDGSVEKVWIGELSKDQTREIQELLGT